MADAFEQELKEAGEAFEGQLAVVPLVRVSLELW